MMKRAKLLRKPNTLGKVTTKAAKEHSLKQTAAVASNNGQMLHGIT